MEEVESTVYLTRPLFFAFRCPEVISGIPVGFLLRHTRLRYGRRRKSLIDGRVGVRLSSRHEFPCFQVNIDNGVRPKHWRVFLFFDFVQARFPEGFGYRLPGAADL